MHAEMLGIDLNYNTKSQQGASRDAQPIEGWIWLDVPRVWSGLALVCSVTATTTNHQP